MGNPETVWLYVSYPGDFKIGTDTSWWSWEFVGGNDKGKSIPIRVPKTISFVQLYEKLVEKLEIDSSLYKMVLRCPCPTSNTMPPIVIEDDSFMEWLISCCDKTNLCITLLKNYPSDLPKCIQSSQNPLGSCSSTGTQRRIVKKIEPSLDIIIEILSWLPVKDVLRCRCVCKKWRDLTSNRDFIDLHSRRSLPMMLKDYRGDVALLDRCWEFARTKAKIHKIYEQYDSGYKFSHNGLIVTHCFNDSFNIYNPIYRDTVNLRVPLKLPKIVYGVFFHPVQKEHCALWRMTLSLKPLKVQYRILNLESNPQWRDIKNPSTQNAWIRGIRPILIDNKYLYWMVEPSENYDRSYDSTFSCDIMEYDIRNENFRVIPCPVPVTVKKYQYNVNLVELDDVVSLVHVFSSKELVEINIWTLKDHGALLWTSSQYTVSSDVYPGEEVPKAVAYRNGELVLESDGRLYVCNLKIGTFRKFGQRYLPDYVTFLSHVPSLVSLRNCKSKICMTEENEKIIIECGRVRPNEIQEIR